MKKLPVLSCLFAVCFVWPGWVATTVAQEQIPPSTFRYTPLSDLNDPLAMREIASNWPSGSDESAILEKVSAFEIIARGHFEFGQADQNILLALVREKSDAEISDRPLCLAIDVNRDSVLELDELFEGNSNASDQWLVRIPSATQSDRDLANLDSTAEESTPDPSQPKILEYQFLIQHEQSRFRLGHAGHAVGEMECDGQKYAAVLIDQNANGRWTDAQDRLLIDWDGDGKFSPLRERYSCQQVIQRSGNRYTLAFHHTPPRMEPITGSGNLTLELKLADGNAAIEFFEATIVSTSGVHLTITDVDQSETVPVGEYFIKQLRFKLKADQHWSYSFQHLEGADRTTAIVENGGELKFDVLNGLKLYARTTARTDELSIRPVLLSGTGLYLTRCLNGKQSASIENRLIATRVGAQSGTKKSDWVKSTGFTCGTFCPIEFDTDPESEAETVIQLQFDSGPITNTITATIEKDET